MSEPMNTVMVQCKVRGAANAQAIFDTLCGFKLMGSEPLGVRWTEPQDKRKAHVITFKHFSADKAEGMLKAIHHPHMNRVIKCVEVGA